MSDWPHTRMDTNSTDPRPDPRIAALAEALVDLFPAVQRDRWPFTPDHAAAAVLAALPSDWCGHDWGVVLSAESIVAHNKETMAEITRLRKIEEAARALQVQLDEAIDDAEDIWNARDTLRAALEAKP